MGTVIDSESTHWYRRDGTPAYEIERADGKGLRPTTLRDARKLSLLPSFTTIVKAAGTPAGLVQYFVKSAVMASLTLPRINGESDDDYIARILTDSREEGISARDTGTEIHGAIERVDTKGEWAEWVFTAYKALPDTRFAQEKSFVHLGLGYGCKLDLHAEDFSLIIDVKTKDGPAAGRKLWIEETMQLAAQRFATGHPEAKCGILHVDRNNPTAELLMATEQELTKGLACFRALRDYYYASTGLGLQ